MSDPFLDAESGVETSAPREGIEFSTGVSFYRFASGDQDIVISGNVYTASPISRSEQAISMSTGPAAMTVQLPVGFPIAQRYLVNGVPPRQLLVTIRRQESNGFVEQIWCGYATSLGVDKHIASFLVPSRSGEAFKRLLPVITVSRTCPHILYDANCKVDRNAFKVSATVVGYDGRTIDLSTIGGHPGNWALWGEVLHVASGERMTVISQVGTFVEMQAPIYELRNGDTVTLYAGCSHDISTGCRDKFNNVPNFGGFANLPKINPFKQSGFGVIQQT